MKKLIVATSNNGKLKEMKAYLDGLKWQLELKPPELEIEETGKTFMENAILKAVSVAKSLKEWAIADDSGLMVEALNGEPGIYSARYGNLNTDEERNLKILKELGNNPNRRAKFVCSLAISNAEGKIIFESEGVCEGEILKKPQGNDGFGYDPIFYVPEIKQTFAEIPSEIKNQLSHRGKAFEKLLPQLKNFNI
jgi:XTP/dITP diphosphohydrolase